MNPANAQLANFAQHYRSFSITTTTVGVTIRSLLSSLLLLPPGTILSITLTPAASVSIADGYNGNYIAFTAAKTINSLDCLDLLIKAGSGTVAVVCEVLSQEAFIGV